VELGLYALTAGDVAAGVLNQFSPVGARDETVLRMDKKNYNTIRNTAKAQGGRQVEFWAMQTEASKRAKPSTEAVQNSPIALTVIF